MSEFEFHLLSLEEKAAHLFADGVFVEDFSDFYDPIIMLYSLQTFWVELYYNSGEERISHIQIAGPMELNKYLNRIEIPQVIIG